MDFLNSLLNKCLKQKSFTSSQIDSNNKINVVMTIKVNFHFDYGHVSI